MKIAMIGTGYVGLVSGACFAEMGHDVICVDKDEAKIEGLREGIIPIYEPGLEEMVKRNVTHERLSFTTDTKKAVEESLFVFIVVGTQSDVDGSADLKCVLSVAKEVGEYMNDYKIIVTKSTVPVGTAEKVRATIRETQEQRGTNFEFDQVSNPEFLKEGDAIRDSMKPDRIVIGTDNVRTATLMKELYSQFVRTGRPIISMDIKSAEMAKYASNAMLATRISFMNEIANLCNAVGADVDEVRKAVGSDSRIGSSFLFPGIGFGGSCFPKDIRALRHTAMENELPFHLLEAVEKVNQRQKEYMFEKIDQHFKGELKGKTISLWGLAFKPNTDDMREASSLVLIEKLHQAGATVQAYDPESMEETQKELPASETMKYFDSPYDSLEGADAMVLVTEWPLFRSPSFKRVKEMLINPVVFDGRNQYNPAELKRLGFTYYSIGRDHVS